jgi:hypothetical protein
MILPDSALKEDANLLATDVFLDAVTAARRGVTPKACTKSSHAHSLVSASTTHVTIAARKQLVARTAVFV